MRQLCAAVGMALLAAFLQVVSNARADEVRAPVAGTWKMSVYFQGQDIALAIVKVTVTDGKATATVVATGARTFSRARVEHVAVGEQSLHLIFKTPSSTFHVAAYGHKKERRPRVLTGSLEIRNNYEVVTLERTTEKELDQANPATPAEGADLLKKLNTRDNTARVAVMGIIHEKYADRPVMYAAAQRSWQYGIDQGADSKFLSAIGVEYVNDAARFGRELEMHAATVVARTLVEKKNGSVNALVMARRAEKLLTEADAPARQLAVLKTLVLALHRTGAGNATRLKTVKERIARLNDQLDADFEKTAIPFQPVPFTGRKGKSNRVAVVELFTGAYCPPCVAADIAFDALLKTYKPSEVILLQYHLHVPRPDPLTNLDGELRSAVYRVEGTPALFINGKEGPELGGSAMEAEAGYKEVRTLLNKVLEGETKDGLDLAVKRTGDSIEATATITNLAGKNASRLQLFLIEDVVRFPGSNGQRLHHHVVRAVIGDVAAQAPKGKPVPQKFTVSVGDVRKKLAEYLEKSNKEAPFLDDARPLDLKHLKIVALIQENASREILHAVQVDVPEEK